MVSKIENAPNNLRMTLHIKLWTVPYMHNESNMYICIWSWTLNWQSTLQTLSANMYNEGPTFSPFRSTPSVFEIQGCRKSQTKKSMHRVTLTWTWVLSIQKYPVCTKYLYPGPNIWSVSLYGHPFFLRYKLVKNQKIRMHGKEYQKELNTSQSNVLKISHIS